MKQQPEIIEAMMRVEKRKQEKTAVKREEQARQSRYQGVIDRFINEGHNALGSFSETKRIDFNEQESNAIYYSIMATASKHHLPLGSAKAIESATNKFLEGMTWDDCSNFHRECVTSWTNSLPQKMSFIPNPLSTTSLHLLTTCLAVPIHTSRLMVQTDVPTNLRIGMVHRKSD